MVSKKTTKKKAAKKKTTKKRASTRTVTKAKPITDPDDLVVGKSYYALRRGSFDVYKYRDNKLVIFGIEPIVIGSEIPSNVLIFDVPEKPFGW